MAKSSQKEGTLQMTMNFSGETMEARRQCSNLSKVLKEKMYQPRI